MLYGRLRVVRIETEFYIKTLWVVASEIAQGKLLSRTRIRVDNVAHRGVGNLGLFVDVKGLVFWKSADSVKKI